MDLLGEQSIRDLIARAIEAAGISQRELARRVGVTEARMSQILSGRTGTTLRTVERIRNAIRAYQNDAAALPPQRRRRRNGSAL